MGQFNVSGGPSREEMGCKKGSEKMKTGNESRYRRNEEENM